MAAAVVTNYGEDRIISNSIGTTDVHGDGAIQELPTDTSSETFSRKNSESSEKVISSSSYILASDVSDLSGDVERWINGSHTSPPSRPTGTQGSRARVAQRMPVTSTCSNSLWYLVAMILPLFSVHNCVMTLRCTPSTVANAAEVIFHHLTLMCSRAKAHIQRVARDRFAGEVFAATMDVVLVVYALGFLFLSMYQAAMIG
ncbi:uncharacterized protein LOC115442270 [Manduca sexta]|uniref:Uncharacterized protein n=1 Tax=Manduca sexta TaxID=7130 RepID=A0A921Z0N2_MANSE|nr:uncharacterized protein LOC115442270 [Manduca sexta]KAG6448209.1 hypothetical protein O3G_MSEX005393 [Manduca sexta]